MTFLPPPEYDHQPSIPVIEQVMTAAEIERACEMINGPPAKTYHYDGCAYLIKSKKGDSICLIWRIADDIAKRHELAHCNGWKHEEKPPFATIKPSIAFTSVNPPYKPPPWPTNSDSIQPKAVKTIEIKTGTDLISDAIRATK